VILIPYPCIIIIQKIIYGYERDELYYQA